MKIILTLHRDFPESEAAASREFEEEFEDMASYADCTLFLWEALTRIAKGIKEGEERSVAIGVKVEG